MTDVLKPRHIQPPVEDMTCSFDNYLAFKRDMKPEASKIEYKNFLSTMQNSIRKYDSNISESLEHNRRVLSYKYREQGLRAAALKINKPHDGV
jgi:hypothetical protein